jgi:hypothetical protein
MVDRLACLVVTLLLLAGCNRLPLDSGQEQPTETVTPVPVSDRGSTSVPTDIPDATLPPGVRPNGSVDRAALVQAHHDALAGRSFTLVSNENQIQYATERSANFTRRIEVSGDRTLIDEQDSLNNVQQLFLTDCDGFRRYDNDADGEYEYATYDGSIGVGSIDGTDHLRRSLPDREFDVAVVESSGRRYLRLHAPTGYPPERLAESSDSAAVWNYTVTAYVTESGFVQNLQLAYDMNTYYGQPQRIEVSFDYRSVGETTIDSPKWLSRVNTTAGANTTTRDTTTASATAYDTTTAGDTTTARDGTSACDGTTESGQAAARTPTPSNSTAGPR